MNLAPLDRRSITYRAGDEVKTLARDLTVDTEEVMIGVLRDSKSAVKFGWRGPSSMDWLLGDEFDRSIDDISVTPEPVTENTAVASSYVSDDGIDIERDAVPVTAEHDALPADLQAWMSRMRAQAEQSSAAEPVPAVDHYAALRELVADEHDVPVTAPGTSRRAAKRMRQQQRRQLRVSTVTVNLLRSVGALPPSPPVVAPAPVLSTYSPSFFSGGSAVG